MYYYFTKDKSVLWVKTMQEIKEKIVHTIESDFKNCKVVVKIEKKYTA